MSGRERGAGPRSGPLFTAIWVAIPVVAAALLYVWTQVTTVQLGYALSKAGRTHRTLLDQNRALRIDHAALRSPDNLQRLGARFSLAAPRPDQVIRLTEAK